MQQKSRILLTGATGYIGSHTWLALWDAGFDVVGIDDFSNSSQRVLERLHEISGREPQFVKADICVGLGLGIWRETTGPFGEGSWGGRVAGRPQVPMNGLGERATDVSSARALKTIGNTGD